MFSDLVIQDPEISDSILVTRILRPTGPSPGIFGINISANAVFVYFFTNLRLSMVIYFNIKVYFTRNQDSLINFKREL